MKFPLSLAGLACVMAIIGWQVGVWTADRASADLTPPGGGGRWLFSGDIGGASANDLERARAVRSGTFALSAEETVYFFTDRDDQGRMLSGACTYEVTGGTFETEWWSLTVYGDDYFYIPNMLGRSSFNSVNIRYDDMAKATWSLYLSPNDRDGNWLPTPDADGLELLFRLYKPRESLRSVLPDVDLPRIRRVSCVES